MSSIMEVEDILKILPHRYPFMLVDRIIELSEDGDRIVGLKNLSFNEREMVRRDYTDKYFTYGWE